MSHVSSAFVADPELLSELEKRARPLDLVSNRVLFREGESPVGVYILRRGIALLTSHAEPAPLGIRASAGSLLGVPAVVGHKAYSLTAEALEDAEVSFVNSEEFVELMRTQPLLSFQVLKVLAEEVRFARAALREI